MPAQDRHTDSDLLLRVSAGNEQAFSELFHEHHQHLAAYVFTLTASREMAEEVVQDVFIKVWNTRQTLTGVQNFRAWLYVISRNHTLNCLRRVVNEKLKHHEWLRHQSSMPGIDSELISVYTTDSNEFDKAMAAVSQLPPQQQKVFILRQLKNMKYQEIAQQLSVSRETVKSYLKLANTSISKFIGNRRSTLEFWILVLLALHL